ncbi:hypothetical protein [Lentzea aerocolonigenes]|uniref:hypothetical protein n=1 Tax=Lentzea aerocolonigenes TaxID=68170 RepID=UPI0018C8A01B|nr:hypothetical protein [Lentzea aerocolonigenes]
MTGLGLDGLQRVALRGVHLKVGERQRDGALLGRDGLGLRRVGVKSDAGLGNRARERHGRNGGDDQAVLKEEFLRHRVILTGRESVFLRIWQRRYRRGYRRFSKKHCQF